MIKSVIQAEEIYGQSLAKISTTMIETFPGTLQDCFSQLKVHECPTDFIEPPLPRLISIINLPSTSISQKICRTKCKIRWVDDNSFVKLFVCLDPRASHAVRI
jgi:hypothetical protein